MTVLACDMGGTRIKTGIVSNGSILGIESIDANSGRGLAACLPMVADTFRRLCKASGIEMSECAGVGISFPSLFDPATGRMLDAYGKYHDAPGIDFPAWAREEFGLPLAIENDARAALMGEWKHGAGRGSEDIVMITLGTGIGVAAVVGGKMMRGRHGQAAVLGGHITVRHGGQLCHCGNIGCAEAEASTAFLSKLVEARDDFAQSPLKREAVLDYDAVFKHAAADDSCASAILRHSLEVWSSLAVSLIHVFDPEVMILGGGIMASADAILPAVRDYVARHAHTPWGKVRILPAELGSNAALAAAEWLLLDQKGNS